MSPDLTLDITVPDRDVEIALTLDSGQTGVLLGPNGAGKSTVLAAIAGLIRPDRGFVSLGDRDLFAAATKTWVPPHRRSIAMLAQDARLFPHLDARDNVAFGLRARGCNAAAARRRALEWLDEVGMTAYADRRPRELSGGQAQKVAIARALATEPEVLLLDEPLAALDVDIAPELRDLLRRVCAQRTTVLVTHDVLDAALLADQIAIVAGGRILEHGPAMQVLSRPTSDFGARFAGLNLLRGAIDGTATNALRMPDGAVIYGTSEVALEPGSAATAIIAPAAVSIHLDPPQGSPRNQFRAKVVDLVPHGQLIRVRTDQLSADVTAAAASDLGLARGMNVILSVKAAEVSLHSSRI